MTYNVWVFKLCWTFLLIATNGQETNQKLPRKNVAVIGAGVIGISTALAFCENTDSDVTIFFDRPFVNTTSWGPAGLFRLDNGKYRKWGIDSFKRYAEIFRKVGGDSGIQSVSGYITSRNLSLLRIQEANFADIVYDFHYLEQRELEQFNDRRDLMGIHYTAFTTEGRKYVPWMIDELHRHAATFVEKHIESVSELLPHFDVVVNAAGLNGGKVAGDVGPDDVFPIRGVVFEMDAPWQKHFLYEGLSTFTIPTIDSVFMGTVKQDNNDFPLITDQDRDDIQRRYLQLQPAFRSAKVKSEWIGFRPGRHEVRLEAVSFGPKKVIHNYGHGGNGFTLSWGCALAVVQKAYE